MSCKHKKFLYIMSKTTNCSNVKAHYIHYCNVLSRVIRKAKEMYYNEMLTSSTNKSKMSQNITNNETGTATNKRFTQTEYKIGNKNISMNKSAKIFNNYFINSIDELITQKPNTELALFSLRE